MKCLLIIIYVTIQSIDNNYKIMLIHTLHTFQVNICPQYKKNRTKLGSYLFSVYRFTLKMNSIDRHENLCRSSF